MSEEIKSTLGFDVTQALTALDQLDTRLKGLQSTMQSFSRTLGSAGDLKTASKHLDEATKATERLTVSWGMMARIVTTQAIVRALSSLRNEFENTAQAAVNFQRKAAEIQTISPAGTSLDGIKDNIRAISDSLNIPLDRTAAAYYQTLSNGITETADALKFLNEAGKFAKATNSNLSNSVDLLSAVLKSYDMSVEDTAKASSIMFESIRAGRITADELGNTFGRIAPRAAAMGISLEELSAALAAITVRGTKTSEAITYLNGVISSLSKPTPEMMKALNGMGFASAESAIASKGLPGLLKSIADSTDGSAQGLAKLMPNIRAIAGEMALSGKGLKDFADNIRSMEEAGRNLANSKFLQATATDAERVTKELNKLQNALTVELGQSVLHTADEFFKLSGGADNFISLAKDGVPAVMGLGTSLVALTGSMKMASMAGTSLSTALGGLMLVPLAYGAGRSVGNWLNDKTTEDLLNNLKRIEGETKAASDQYKAEADRKLQAAKDADNSIVSSAQEVIRQLNSVYLQDYNNAVATSKKIVEERREAYNKIAEAARKAEQAEKDSQDRIFSLQEKREDILLQKRLAGIDDPQRKARFEAQAGQELSSKAASDMLQAAMKGDADAIKRAAQQFDRARSLMEKAGASNAVLQSIDQQLNVERQIQAIERQKNIELEQQKRNLETVKQLQNQYLEDAKKEGYKTFLNSFGDVGQLEKVLGRQFSSPDAVSRGLIDANKQADELRKKISNAMNPAEASGLKNEINEILTQFDQKKSIRDMWQSSVSEDFTRQLQSIREQIQSGMEKGIDISKIRSLFQQLNELNNQAQSGLNSRLGFGSSLDTLVRALPLLKQLDQLPGPSPDDTQRLQQLENAIRSIQPSVSTIGPAVEAGVGPAAQIEAHFRNSAEYAAQAAAALAAGDSVEKAMGGYIGHFASGGAVGTDTIPAMLSPGEFVINADSSRKFFSQLVAMNAGVAPAHRQQGGTVNNVGDISINVNGNGDARTTGRALLAEIRREIRRGTGIL